MPKRISVPAARGPITVTRKGKSMRTLLAAARRRIRAGAGVPHEDFWQAVESDSETGRSGASRRG
jgi:hypothetical protein